MRPITFHSHIRRIITVGQLIPIIIAGAVASLFFSPFLIGEWIQDKLQNPQPWERTQRRSQECQITNIQEWVEEIQDGKGS